jgi:coiled-coil domain-containing protein 130
MSTLKAARADNMVRRRCFCVGFFVHIAPTSNLPRLPTFPSLSSHNTKKKTKQSLSSTPPQYYPPSFDPTRGSLNTQQGSHPLRGRASKLKSEGILTIRFELPFPVWCGGCGHLMAKGVRFNAGKRAVGHYHSTPILEFGMATPCCGQRLVIRTDPTAAEYEIVEGGRRRADRFSDPTGDGTVELATAREVAAARADPLARAEAAAADRAAGRAAAGRLGALMAGRAARSGADVAANAAARRAARARRAGVAAADAERAALGLPSCVALPPETAADRAAAAAAWAAAGRSGGGGRGGGGGGAGGSGARKQAQPTLAQRAAAAAKRRRK